MGRWPPLSTHGWEECLALMVNEKTLGPKLNPFAVWYWVQFGGPTAADYDRMDPTRPWPRPGGGKKKTGTAPPKTDAKGPIPK